MPQNILVGISNTKTTDRVLCNVRLKRSFGTPVANCSKLVPQSHAWGSPRSTARIPLSPRGTQSSLVLWRMSAQLSGSPASPDGSRGFQQRPPWQRTSRVSVINKERRWPRGFRAALEKGPPAPGRPVPQVSTSPALRRPQTTELCGSGREDTCRHRTRDRDGVRAANSGPLAALGAPGPAARGRTGFPPPTSPHRARRALPLPPPPAAGPRALAGLIPAGCGGRRSCRPHLRAGRRVQLRPHPRPHPRPPAAPSPQPTNLIGRLQHRIPAAVTKRMRTPFPSPFQSACAHARYRRRGCIARRAVGLALPALPPALGEGRGGASRAREAGCGSGVLWVRRCGPAGRGKAQWGPRWRGPGSVVFRRYVAPSAGSVGYPVLWGKRAVVSEGPMPSESFIANLIFNCQDWMFPVPKANITILEVSS